MFAAIDVGNTLVKVGIFEGENLLKHLSFPSLAHMGEYFIDNPAEKTIIASVNQPYDTILGHLPQKQEIICLDLNSSLPFENSYKSETLGIDRIALIAGAQHKYPKKTCLVIDLGTCITYDIITHSATYLGGAISPGLRMRFKSLHNFTARLPLVDIIDNPNWIGDSTVSSIQSGVVNGITAEIDGFIQNYQQQYPELQPIITGGNSNYFESKIKATIFAIPELLLVGLNAILRHNASF